MGSSSGRRDGAGWIEDAAALAALRSSVRQEIVDTIEAIGGDVPVAQIAAQLGRPADGIYYHLRRLVEVGILRASGGGSDGEGRRYRTVAPPGRRVRLKYGRGSRADHAAVTQVVGALLRTAGRDFGRALRGGRANGAGPLRELWASRLKGWVGERELREINRLLVRLGELLQQPRDPRRDRLVSLAWVLAPIPSRPLRRDAAGADGA